MSKMTHHLKNYQENLNQHQLATPSLRKLLRTIGQPTTPEDKRIMASVARAYERMGDTFPTKELSEKLNALYSHAVSLTDRVAGCLVSSCSRLQSSGDLSQRTVVCTHRPETRGSD
jgi:hypothetical protein